jgi:hypothetical protein
MTTAFRITSAIFALLSGLLWHFFAYPSLFLFFTIVAILLLLASLFTHRIETKKESIDFTENNAQNKQPANDSTTPNDRWNNPLGKIILAVIGSVIAGTIVIFIGIAINQVFFQSKTDKKTTDKNLEHQKNKIEIAQQKAPPSKDSLSVSRQMYLASQEPFLDIQILELKKDSKIKFKITNNSKIDIADIKINERLYASSFNDLSIQKAIGSQPAIPTLKIDNLKLSKNKEIETSIVFNSQLLMTEIAKGDTGGFFELHISFRHGLTGKQYSQVCRFLILPSVNGWKANEFDDNSLWAVKSFMEQRNSRQ